MDKGEIDPAATAATVTPAKAGAQFRMDRTERFYKIDHLIRERGVVPVSDFLRELEVSLATFKRDIECVRSRHHAPIEWDREAGGYRFVKADSVPMGARKHEPKHFELVASAVLNRQRLKLTYWNRAKDEVTEREVSPQR